MAAAAANSVPAATGMLRPQTQEIAAIHVESGDRVSQLEDLG